MGIILWNEEEESPSAWRTPDRDGRVWEHLSAETDGGTGLSMMVEEPDLYWVKNGPALHFRGLFTGGKYYSYFPLDNAFALCYNAGKGLICPQEGEKS